MNPSVRIALFGGTFDPVHLGHLQLAEQARCALALDEVWFLPCWVSPHKEENRPTSGDDRVAMLRLAVDGLPWARVEDFEVRREGVSYSYQTAEALCGPRPDVRWYWIMGGDQWEALPRWSHPERLASRVEFIVFEREGKPVEPRAGFRMHAIAGGHPASASGIRRALRGGCEDHPWLPRGVGAWIRERGLYGVGGGSPAS